MSSLNLAAGEDGFSLTEMLVASVLLLLVVSAVAGLANLAGHAAEAQPEAVDAQQRARFGASSLFRDLHAAGAGVDAGPLSGPLSRYFPPILPRRIGALAADVSTTARPDALSMIWVPTTHVQTTVVGTFSTSSMAVADEPGCPIGRPMCGMRSGLGIVVFDRSGHFDLFTVEAATTTGAAVRRRGSGVARIFGDGASVAEVEARTYYFDGASRQLRLYDTDLTDVPVMDDVVGMVVEYFGLPSPPVSPRPPADESNCLYDVGGGRRPGLSSFPVAADGLAPLPLERFTDGPWCGVGETAYDADLLRVRRVRVTLRVQASSATLRGSGDRFAIAGSSRSAWRLIEDIVLTFDIAPRNLDLGD